WGRRHGHIFEFDGGVLRFAAGYGTSPELRKYFDAHPVPLGPGSASGLAASERRTVQIADIHAMPGYQFGEAASLEGWRTVLAVPMVKDRALLGTMTIWRTEGQAFTDGQIALVKTFADQAVIAIENARLFNETKEALEQQTATAEILGVISGSPTDIQPVFDAVLDRALTLCEASHGSLYQFEDGTLRHVAARGTFVIGFAVGGVLPLGSATGRAVLEKRTVHFEDVQQELDWQAPEVQVGVRGTGIRTVVAVPLLREQTAIGAIMIRRLEVRPFSEKQIRLLQTFADQAVIAIENVRLFKELEARTQDLTRSVGELRALGEVGQALSSTLDVDVVLDTIVARANDLIGADGCTIFEYDEAGEQFHLRATRNLEPRLVELARGRPLRKGDQGILGQLPMRREAIQVPDITVGSYSSPISDALIEAGYRAVVAVPLIREDHLIGALTMNRKTPGEFPRETIELLHTFATQSALAIQNARLYREIAKKSEQLAVASRH